MQVAIVVLALAAVVAADVYSKPTYHHSPSYSAPSYKADDYAYAPAHYKYDYAVKDDYYNDFGQYEARDGDKTTGNYWVVLPDGRKQNVNYYVDGYSGYVADVTYDGYAKSYDSKPAYESYKPAYKPEYKPEYKPAYETYKPAYETYKPVHY